MLPGPFSSQNIFRQGTGEATVLKSATPDPNLALATEQQKRLREAEATPEKMIAAWDTDYFPLVDQMRTEKEQIASRVAKGELTPEKAAIEYRRRADELVSLGQLTQKQEKDWNAVGEIYAKDDKGLYNTTQGYTNMNIYKSPEKYAEAIPQIAEQLKSVGGDRVMWRAKYGTPYLQPALAYDHNKMINDEFGKIEEITGARLDPLTGMPGLTGITVTEQTNPNVASIVDVGRRIREQALTGNNFKAQEFYKTANQYINNNLQIDPSGNVKMTPAGKVLLNTMTEHFGYDPETGTIMTGPGQRQELTPELMQRYMYDAYTIQEGIKLQERKTKINATLRQQTNVNVKTGGGPEKKADLGYYTTQTEAFTNWQTKVAPTLEQQFNTPEARNTDDYIQAIQNSLGQAFGIKQAEGGGFINFTINAKDVIEAKNRAVKFDNLYIRDPEGNVIKKVDMDGEVSGLEPSTGQLTVGVWDPRKNRYRIVSNKELKDGTITPDMLVPLGRFVYKLPPPPEEKGKKSSEPPSRIKGEVTEEAPAVESTTIKELRKMMADQGLTQIVELVPFNEKGVAQSWDDSFSTKDDYGSSRKQGGGNVGEGEPNSMNRTKTILDNVFNQ